MQTTHSAFLGLVAITVTGALCAQETGTLKFKAHKKFNFVMPKDVWTNSAGGLRVRHVAGDRFRAMRDGVKMVVDTTGDGETNGVVKGSKGYLRFMSKKGGKKFEYAARFKGGNGIYQYSSACSMSGTVGGVPIRLFDLNNNGSFSELEADAIIVGKGKAATYLSKVISYKGELYNLIVADDGKSATVSAYEGDSGKLSLAAFLSKGKLESAIVSDGKNSFQVGRSRGYVVPTGEYKIVAGMVRKGSATARIRGGKMAALRVRADKIVKLKWGGPLIAEFTHTLGGGKVTVDPKNLSYFGKAGVEFYGWAPDAKSPKFKVHDPDTGKEVGGFIFAGC